MPAFSMPRLGYAAQEDRADRSYLRRNDTCYMNTTLPLRTVLTLIFIAAVSVVRAQSIDTLKTWSVEEFAQKMTDQMTTRVPLAADQIDMVHRINLKFAGQVMPVVKGSGDQQSKLSQVKAFDRQRSDELEIFLNAEQMRQVRQIQYENRKKMKQRYYEKNL